MPDIYALQSIFNKGELTPKLHARTDLDYYRSGLSLCRNFHVLVHGGVSKRSGTAYITDSLRDQIGASQEHAHLLPFIFNQAQSYVLEFGDFELGFLSNGGVVESPPGTRYTIATPYSAAELGEIAGVQSADVVYLVHPNHPIQKLSRFAEAVWTLTAFNPENGPFLDVNVSDNALDPTGLGLPSITMSGGVNPYGLLNSDPNAYWYDNVTAAAVTFDLGAGGLVCAGYTITASHTQDQTKPTEYTQRNPRKWSFLGSDDLATWETLDRRVAETDWLPNELRSYYFTNDYSYRYYRLDIETNNGHQSWVVIGAMQLYLKGRAGNIDFDDTTGVNINDAGLDANDVGRQVRWQGKDGFWRYFTITGVASTTSASGDWEGFWEWNPAPGTLWSLAAFSKNSGYPRAVSLFQERLIFSGTVQQPRTVFMSVSGNYEDFTVPDPVTDTSPITVTLAGSRQDRIEWTREVEELLMIATSDGIASLGGTDTEILSITNIRQRKHAAFGAAAGLLPVRVGTILLFVGAKGRSLHELVYSAQANGYDAPAVSVLADHFYQSGVTDMDFAQSPNDAIYMSNGDGDIITLVYEREQKVVGHSLFEFGGGQVLSLTVVPEDNRDALYMVMRRTIDGTVRHYIERLQPAFNFGN
jgi:hypothetical protein